MPNTGSGSIPGWQVQAKSSSPDPLQKVSVVSHTVPQIGAQTL